MPESTNRDDLLTRLSLSLGQLRADFSSDREIQLMFSQPRYWSELVASRPCFLVGGRGTGKTTTLRALSFRRQAQIAGTDPHTWHLIGAYWRVESNVTTAFTGDRIDDQRWTALFSHYVNLRLCDLVFDYLCWADEFVCEAPLAASSLAHFCASVHIDTSDSLTKLRDALTGQIVRLEASLNHDPQALAEMPLSVLGQPVRHLLSAVDPQVLPEDVVFAFCIDEYENFLGYQQRIINTLVKHVGDSAYTLKIGVRSTTRGERATLATDQPLQDAVDYTTIDIVQHLKDQSFTEFAASVCAKRLEAGLQWSGDVPDLFVGLSLEAEALILGVDRPNAEARHDLEAVGATQAELAAYDAMTPLNKYMISFWAQSAGESRLLVLRDAELDPATWSTRVGNYAYASLFTIRAGLRGTRKYYAGWSMICHLAAGNIRTLLRLVHEALRIHVAETGKLSPISPADQTTAAMRVGESMFGELRQTHRGGEITRLVLALGRVFSGFAASPEGRAPEVNQFRVSFKTDRDHGGAVRDLLDAGVVGGALERFAGNKQGRLSGGTKAPDYQLLPVFAPYFVYSHRRKRRLTVTEDEVTKLASNDAASTITRLLHKGSRRRESTPALPDQLRFYEDFFDET